MRELKMFKILHRPITFICLFQILILICNKTYAQVSVKGGESASSIKYSFVLKNPKRPKGTLKQFSMNGCWIDKAKTIRATDKTKKKVKIKRSAGNITLKKLDTYKLPITVNVTMPEVYARQIEASSISTSLLIPCGKKDKKCKKPKVKLISSVTDGLNCLPDSDLPFDTEDGESAGRLELDPPANSSFYPTGSGISLHPVSVLLSTTSPNVTIKLNDGLLDQASYSINSDSLKIHAPLREGKNKIWIITQDADGKDIFFEGSAWAGLSQVNINVVDFDNKPVDGANVTLALADNKKIKLSGITTLGKVTFLNIPETSLVVDAIASNNLQGWAVGTPSDSPITITFSKTPLSSGPLNGTFDKGLDGWKFKPGTVSLVPHQPLIPNQKIEPSLKSYDLPSNSSIGYLDPSGIGWQDKDSSIRARSSHHLSQTIRDVSKSGGDPVTSTDLDMQVSTSHKQGITSASHTFDVKPDTNSVKVRYRFITSEVPGGYFGSKFNDYYRITLSAGSGATKAVEAESMNALGLSAFDKFGATDWKELSLPLNQSGEKVTIEVGVANVADNYLDSFIEVDLVEEKFFSITAATLNDIDGTTLGMISADTHTYFDGKTIINGSITLEGPKDHTVQSLELEILRGKAIVASGSLDIASQTLVYKKFDESEKIEIPANGIRFEISSAQLAALDDGTNEFLRFILRSKTDVPEDQEATYEVGSYSKLSLFEGSRYGSRDSSVGGDDWLKPSVKSFITSNSSLSGLTYGDFSNMNGGPFPPHSSHDSGNSADAWFSGYNARDASVASQILSIINACGPRVSVVYVTYSKIPSDTFWNAINGISLLDGRTAESVIVPHAGHSTHFHLEITD